MDGISIDTSGMNHITIALASSAVRVGATGSKILRRTAFAIQADAQSLAPVDTGALRSSISTTITGDGRYGSMTAEIGPTVDYGVHQEYGTSRMAGKAYMGPAFDRQLEGFTQVLGALAAQALL